jgi:hypothetical protein
MCRAGLAAVQSRFYVWLLALFYSKRFDIALLASADKLVAKEGTATGVHVIAEHLHVIRYSGEYHQVFKASYLEVNLPR